MCIHGNDKKNNNNQGFMYITEIVEFEEALEE